MRGENSDSKAGTAQSDGQFQQIHGYTDMAEGCGNISKIGGYVV